MGLPRGPIHVDAMFQNPPVYHVVSTWNLPHGDHVVCTLGSDIFVLAFGK